MNEHPLKTELASELTLAKMKIHQTEVELSNTRLDVDYLQRELARANDGWDGAAREARLRLRRLGLRATVIGFGFGVAAGLLVATYCI